MAYTTASLNQELAGSWPFFKAKPGEPLPLEAIDTVAVDVTDPAKLNSITSSLEPRFVEEVLESLLNRVSTCLELREKAHTIQALEVQNANLLIALEANGGAAHEIAYLNRLKESGRLPGHGLNYQERFHYLRSLFSENLKQAVARAKVTAEGMKAVYGVADPPFPEPTTSGYLDALALWAQKISDALHLELQSRRITTVLYSLRSYADPKGGAQIFSTADWSVKLAARDFTFSFDKAQFEGWAGKEPRLRRVTFTAVSKQRATSIWLGDLQITSAGKVVRSPVVLTSSGPETAEMHAVSATFHNVDPLSGDWQLRLDPSTIDRQDDTVENILLYLTVSVKA